MRIIGGVAVAALLAVSQANGIVAFNNTGVVQNSGSLSGAPYALGNDFIVNTPIIVTGVGAFDSGADGFLSSIPVAIYYVTAQGIHAAGDQVSGTSMTLSGTPSGSHSWNYSAADSRFMNILPVTLGPGTYSIVAANYGGGGEPFYYSGGGGTAPSFAINAAITEGSGRFATLSAGLVYPGTAYGGSSVVNFAAGTFDFTPVPEVAHFALAGVGLLGLVYIGRYARLRRIMKPA